MKKIALALIVGTGLALGAAPKVHAAASSSTGTIIQTLNTPELSAAKFKSLFEPYNTAILSPFRFDGSTTDSGLIQSQVFKGTGAADGLYAYAYQVAVNSASGSSGVPAHVDSTSFKFNATPIGTDFAGGQKSYGYVIKDGVVGGLNLPGTQSPTTLSWQPAGSTGFIRAQYVDPVSQTGPLDAGVNSATFVLISNQLPADVRPSVNVGGAAATTTIPVAYTTQTGDIAPIPVPEPATWLAWSGMAAAVAFVARVRKARVARA
ncbi:MAG: hypothetical protein U0794_13390 [Isosphaeraceae bacterium]